MMLEKGNPSSKPESVEVSPTLTKSIQYTVTRYIESTPVCDNFVAFRDEIKFGDFHQEIKEGITTIEELDKVHDNLEIPTSKFDLWHKNIEDVFRNNQFGYNNNYETFRKEVIKNPFTYIQENGLNDASLYYINDSSFLCDINDRILPSALYFDYIWANVHNGRYDLVKSLEILKKRDDIRFEKEGIQQVPYYNSRPSQEEYLSFFWTPSEEDFAKTLHVLGDSFKRFQFILQEILVLPPTTETFDDEDDY